MSMTLMGLLSSGAIKVCRMYRDRDLRLLLAFHGHSPPFQLEFF